MHNITWTDIVIAVIAILAFLRPDLYNLYLRLFRRGRVQVRKNGKLEVGYAGYGHTLRANLSLMAEYEDIFIDEVIIRISNQQTNSTSTFKWMAFRSPVISPGLNQEPDMEIAGGFLLKKDTSKSLNIVLNDQNTANVLDSRIYPIFENLKAKLKEEADIIKEEANQMEESDKQQFLTAFLESKYIELEKSNDIHQISEIVTDLFYWNPGKYRGDVEAICFKPKTINRFGFDFEISQSDSHKLYSNAKIMSKRLLNAVFTAAASNEPVFNFVYLDYEVARK